MKFIRNFLNMFYPVLAGIALILFVCKYNISYTIKGFSNVLESVISFSSIIIGFYTAMYGVLLTVSNSELMIKIREKNLSGFMRFQLYDSLFVAFLVLIISVVLQSLRFYPSLILFIVFRCWAFLLGYFIATSFRAVSLFLNILFNHKKKKRRTSDQNLSKSTLDDIHNEVNRRN